MNALLGASVVATAYGLKRHYSTAGAEELEWILRPTAALVSAVTGRPFTAERYVGFGNHDVGIVIVPACAGVNYLIIAFSMLSLAFLHCFSSVPSKALWIVGSAVVAFGATIVVNATRIGTTVFLREHLFAERVLSGPSAHRIEGVVLYLSSLILLYAGAEALVRRRAA